MVREILESIIDFMWIVFCTLSQSYLLLNLSEIHTKLSTHIEENNSIFESVHLLYSVFVRKYSCNCLTLQTMNVYADSCIYRSFCKNHNQTFHTTIISLNWTYSKNGKSETKNIIEYIRGLIKLVLLSCCLHMSRYNSLTTRKIEQKSLKCVQLTYFSLWQTRSWDPLTHRSYRRRSLGQISRRRGCRSTAFVARVGVRTWWALMPFTNPWTLPRWS